ncbi:MAG: FliM/FliN family flagellar motor switch protein [Bacillota bacterium]
MAEALSQSQIDALLANLGGDGSESESIETESKEQNQHPLYDFYSPKKFTKDKLNMIKTSYETYSRVLTSRINSLFRVSSEITIIGVEEERYYEFNNAIYDNDAVFKVEPQFKDKFEMSPIVMNTSKPLILSLIDRMLGGTGEDFVDVDYSYSYTDMELSVCRNFYVHFVKTMKEGWANYLDIEFELVGIDTPHGVLQEIGVDEIVVIVIMEIKLDDGITGKTNICIPATLLSKIFSTIEKSKKIVSGKGLNDKDNTPQQIFETIKDSTLDVIARLGEGTAYLRDIYDLQVGDILNLNVSKETEVDVYVDETPWFKGKLGVQKKNIAIKVNSNIKNDIIL